MTKRTQQFRWFPLAAKRLYTGIFIRAKGNYSGRGISNQSRLIVFLSIMRIAVVIFSRLKLGVTREINALATLIIDGVALAVLVAGWMMLRQPASGVAVPRGEVPAGSR